MVCAPAAFRCSTRSFRGAFKSCVAVALAVGLATGSAQADSEADAGIYTLTRLAVSAIGSFVHIGPDDQLDIDLLDRVRAQRTGFHAEYRLVSGERAVIGSPRNARTSLSDIPGIFIAALLATEDARFLEHPGLAPTSTARAFFEHLSGTTRGASGITQQLLKNQIVGSDVTFRRKAIEASLAIQIEDVLSKGEILEAYLGAVWFGRGWGAAGAARSWFGKNWDDLSLSEMAFLAGILQGPARFNPEHHAARAHARRDHVLGRMLITGVISEEDYRTARSERLEVILAQSAIGGQEWTDVVLERWIEANSATAALLEPRAASGTLPVIETTLDGRWQSLAQQSLNDQVARLGRIEAINRISDSDLATLETHATHGERLPQALWTRVLEGIGADARVLPAVVLGSTPSTLARARGWGVNNTWEIAEHDLPQPLSRGDVVLIDRENGDLVTSQGLEGAVVIMNIHTGEVLASVGGTDTRLSRFDRTTSPRQPGSAVKAFVYLAAMEMGWFPQDIIDDSPTDFDGGYSPRNFGERHRGIIPFYTAFEISSNIAAVKIANEIGIANVSDIARRAGAYEQQMALYLPSALGASVTSLRQLVTGYATIGNGGWPIRPTLVRRIIDRDGRVWESDPASGRNAFSARAIDDMQAMMRGVILRGTAAETFRNHPVSVIGKTGTSQGHRDALFVGMGADIAVGVWLGRDDNTPTNGFVGGAHAAPVAARIFRQAYETGMITEYGHDMERNSQRFWPPEAIGERARSGWDTIQPAWTFAEVEPWPRLGLIIRRHEVATQTSETVEVRTDQGPVSRSPHGLSLSENPEQWRVRQGGPRGAHLQTGRLQ